MIEIRLNLRDYTTAEEVITEFNKINDIREEYELNIILYKYVLPEILALVVALYKYKIHSEFTIELTVSGSNSYAERIDFYTHMGLPTGEGNRYNSDGRFIEITKFNQENNIGLVNSMIRIFRENLEINDDVLGCMNYCLFEVVDNVRNHANSIIDGYLVAQRFQNKRELRLIFIDCGIGIHKSLTSGRNVEYRDLTEEEALEYCIKQYVTNGNNGMGNGLYHTSQFVKSNNGTLVIYSGNKKIIVRSEGEIICDVPYYKGTIVSLVINMDNPVDLAGIFGSREAIPVCVSEYDECINELW